MPPVIDMYSDWIVSPNDSKLSSSSMRSPLSPYSSRELVTWNATQWPSRAWCPWLEGNGGRAGLQTRQGGFKQPTRTLQKKSDLHFAIVSSGDVTLCPNVRLSSKIS